MTEWGEILRASTGTLQTQATIYSVCVEPLLRIVFAERPAELQLDRDALARVKGWTRRLPKVPRDESCPQDRETFSRPLLTNDRIERSRTLCISGGARSRGPVAR